MFIVENFAVQRHNLFGIQISLVESRFTLDAFPQVVQHVLEGKQFGIIKLVCLKNSALLNLSNRCWSWLFLVFKEPHVIADDLLLDVE